MDFYSIYKDFTRLTCLDSASATSLDDTESASISCKNVSHAWNSVEWHAGLYTWDIFWNMLKYEKVKLLLLIIDSLEKFTFLFAVHHSSFGTLTQAIEEIQHDDHIVEIIVL